MYLIRFASIVFGVFYWSSYAHGVPQFNILNIEGRVEISLDSIDWEVLERPRQLQSGVWIRTSRTGVAVLLLPDETQTRIGASTTLRLQAAASEDESISMDLTRGKLWSKTNRKKLKLEIRVPKATASVRGTEWLIDVLKTGSTEISVLEGTVSLTNAIGGNEDVSFGQKGEIDSSGRISVTKLVNPENALQFIYPFFPEPLTYRPAGSIPGWASKLIALAEAKDYEALLTFKRAGDGPPICTRDYQQLADDAPSSDFQSDWEAWSNLLCAEVMLAIGDNDQARSFISQNRWPDAKLVEAKRLIVLGQLEAANDLLLNLKVRPITSAAILFQRGVIATSLGKLKLADALFNRSAAIDPDNASTWQYLTEVALLRGQVELAKRYLNFAASIDPDSIAYLGQLARYQVVRGELDSAAVTLDRLRDREDGGDPRGPLAAALVAIKKNDDGKAREEILRSTAAAPNISRAQLYQGVIHLHKRETELAQRQFGHAARLDPMDPLPKLLSAQLYAAEFEFEQAIAVTKSVEDSIFVGHSLREISNDQIGGPTVGRRYYEVGLPITARFAAEGQFDSRWAGSQLFSGFSSRTDFERTGRYLLGFSLDSLTLGTRRDYPEALSRPGNHGFLRGEYSSGNDVVGKYVNVGANGRLNTSAGDIAYLMEAGSFEQSYENLPGLSSNLDYQDDIALFGIGWRPNYENSLVLIVTAAPFSAEHDDLNYSRDESRVDIGYSHSTDDVIRILHLAGQESDGKEISSPVVSNNPYFEPTDDFDRQCEDKVKDDFRGAEAGLGEIGRLVGSMRLQWAIEWASVKAQREIGWSHKTAGYCYIDSDFWDPVLRDDLFETLEASDLVATVGLSNRPSSGITWDVALRYSDEDVEFHDRMEIEYGGWFAGTTVFEDVNVLSGSRNRDSVQFGLGARIPILGSDHLLQLAYMEERRPFTEASIGVVNYGGISPRYDWLHPGGEIEQFSAELRVSPLPEISIYIQHELFEVENNRLFVDYFLAQESARRIRRLALNRYQSPLHHPTVVPDRRLDRGDFEYSAVALEKRLSEGFSVSAGLESWDVDYPEGAREANKLPDKILHVGSSIPVGRGLLAIRYIHREYQNAGGADSGHLQLRQRVGNKLDITLGGEISRGGEGFYYVGFEGYF